MISNSDVVVVIPVYKGEIDVFETISLKQAFSVLEEYDIVLVAPSDLEVNYPELYGKKYKIERFDAHFFSDVKGYSQLCLSEIFYERFVRYNYMFIYQLDAFVFRDELSIFCSRGFDYIGAPIPEVFMPFAKLRVGNGGVSLRKIESMLRLLEDKQTIIELAKHEFGDLQQKIISTEDTFIVYSIERIQGVDYKRPDYDGAFEFSVEFDMDNIYDRLREKNPFAVHRWSGYRFDFWWDKIKRFGYDLSDEEIELARQKSFFAEKRYEQNTSIFQMIQSNNEDVKKCIRFFFSAGKVSIWGLGSDYHICKMLLKYGGVEIINKYDAVLSEQVNDVLDPNEQNLINEEYPIIIATSKYVKEMSEILDRVGKSRNVDYFTIDDVYHSIICEMETIR